MKVKKFFVYFLLICLVIFQLPLTVHAELSKAEGKKLLSSINKSMNRSADYGVLMSVYSALKTTGFSDTCCAAILVNMNRESSIKPDSGQDGGGAIGLIQWDGGRRDNLQKYSEKQNDTKYTVKGYKIGDIGTQVAFIMEELDNKGEWGGVAPGDKSYYKNFDTKAAIKQINDKSIDITKKITKDKWKKMTNPVAASLYFTSQYERCGYGIDIYEEGAKQANDMYKLLTGTDVSTVSSSADTETSKKIASAMVTGGFWDEAKLASYCKLTEINIDELYLQNANRDSLTSNELSNLSNWENNINKAEESNSLVGILRSFVSFLGIIFTVWAIFLYIAYWMDRLNTLIDLDFLKLLTFGRIVKSPDETECTFNVKDLGNFKDTQPKTVNHKAILGICMVSLSFGVLLVSGIFYNVLSVLIFKLLKVLK